MTDQGGPKEVQARTCPERSIGGSKIGPGPFNKNSNDPKVFQDGLRNVQDGLKKVLAVGKVTQYGLRGLKQSKQVQEGLNVDQEIKKFSKSVGNVSKHKR